MTSSSARLPMTQVLLCGAAIATLSMGIRHGLADRLALKALARDGGEAR